MRDDSTGHLSIGDSQLLTRYTLVVIAALCFVAAPEQPLAAVVTQDFNCGSIVCGNLTVTYDDKTSFANPFQVVAGDNTSWSALATMNITAAATPTNGASEKWAWMQAIITDETPDVLRDIDSNILAAPYPDTPPGGYIWDPYGPLAGFTQPFDYEPWYGSWKIGDLTLVDNPTRPTNLYWGFESWLVCVIDVLPNIYDVIPLIGFTWHYNGTKGTVDQNGNGIIGDSILEYTGDTFVSALMQGGSPSLDFRTGYAKYFNIIYSDNNDTNCTLYHCVPEPSSLALFGLGLAGIGAVRRKKLAA